MPRLTIRPAARADLIEIGDYIAFDNPGRALSFIDEIMDVIMNEVALDPGRFPRREDLAAGLRVARHGRYLIFFREDDDTVEVVRVLHGARNLPTLLRE